MRRPPKAVIVAELKLTIADALQERKVSILEEQLDTNSS